MTDSDPQLIRHATIDDLDALAAMNPNASRLPRPPTARPCAPESRPIRNVSGY